MFDPENNAAIIGMTKPLFKTLGLLSLPGADISRFCDRITLACTPELKVSILTGREILARAGDMDSRLLFVLDVRSPWVERLDGSAFERYLDKVLMLSDAIVFLNLSQTQLPMQIAWQDWLQRKYQQLNCKKPPILRAMQSDLSASSLNVLWQLPKNGDGFLNVCRESFDWPELEALTFAVQNLNLTHLTMGLEGVMASGVGQVWSVKGCFMTPDYLHPIELSLTPLRYEVCKVEVATGQLTCLVSQQDAEVLRPYLKQVLQACAC